MAGPGPYAEPGPSPGAYAFSPGPTANNTNTTLFNTPQQPVQPSSASVVTRPLTPPVVAMPTPTTTTTPAPALVPDAEAPPQVNLAMVNPVSLAVMGKPPPSYYSSPDSGDHPTPLDDDLTAKETMMNTASAGATAGGAITTTATTTTTTATVVAPVTTTTNTNTNTITPTVPMPLVTTTTQPQSQSQPSTTPAVATAVVANSNLPSPSQPPAAAIATTQPQSQPQSQLQQPATKVPSPTTSLRDRIEDRKASTPPLATLPPPPPPPPPPKVSHLFSHFFISLILNKLYTSSNDHLPITNPSTLSPTTPIYNYTYI